MPEKELQRRPGVRFSATCRSCATRFSVRWEDGDLVTEADEILAEDHDERHVFAKGARIDKYEIEEALASGGSSTVYRAFDSGANRTVALKVLHRTDSEYGMRFRREVEVQGNLKHPNLMPIFDHGVVDGKPYYTMELLHKPMTLDTVIGLFRNRRLSYHPTLRRLNSLAAFVRLVVLPAARAISFANRNGVVHRDLKPGNVIIDGKTLHVYVIDFGICHLFRTTGSRIVLRAADEHGDEEEKLMTMGTLRCMPPEQARGGVSEQGDVWSLGALLYHLLAGDAPIPPAIDLGRVSLDKRMANLAKLVSSSRAAGDEEEATFYEAKLEELRSGAHRTMKDLLRDALQGNYTPLPEGVDPQLKAIVERAMQVDPKRRYVSVDALCADLQSWLDGRPVRAYSSALRPLRGSLYRMQLFSRRHSNALLATVVVLLVLGAGAALWQFRARSAEERDIKQWLYDASHTLDPAVQENRLNRILVRRPGQTEAEHLLATVRRYKPLRAQVLAARKMRQEISRVRGKKGGLAEIRRRADDLDDMAAVLEVVADELAALPEDFPGRAMEDEARGLVHYLRARRTVQLSSVPLGTRVSLVSSASRHSLELRWDEAEDWGTAPLPIPERFVDPGSHVIIFRAPSGRAVYLPFVTDHVTPPRLQVQCPMDPADLPEGMVFVAGATGMEFGDLRFSEETVVADVKPFLLDEHEVTNAEYAAYLASLDAALRTRAVPRELLPGPGSRTRPLWTDVEGDWVMPDGVDDLPVTGISYIDARNYAWWAGKRLPTAHEWELAARGYDRRDYSFGMELDRNACNAQTGTIARVGSFPRDRSPFGVLDLAGNVAEWIESGDGEMAVAKGGSFELPRYHALATAHDRRRADLPQRDVGFRCAKDLPE